MQDYSIISYLELPFGEKDEDILLSNAVARAEREWLECSLIISGKLIANPTLWDELIWQSKVLSIPIGSPVMN